MSETLGVYLAAPTESQSLMRIWRRELLDTGRFMVTSRWLNRDLTQHPDVLTAQFPLWGRENVADIMSARIVIGWNSGGLGRGGRHTDFGMGLAFGKQLVVIGPQQHIYHYFPGVEVFRDWVGFMIAVESGWGVPR